MHSTDSKIALGISGEKVAYGVTKSVFKAKDGFRVKPVDWSNYTYGDGLDLRVFERNRQVMAIEVKNWNWQDRPYGLDIVRREIIDRFKNYAGGLKVLIFTFLCLLTSEEIEEIKRHGIQIIEVGSLITKDLFKSSIFFQIKAKLASIWNRRTQILRDYQSINQTKLDKYTNNNNHSNTNYSLTHDTDIRKLIDYFHGLGIRLPDPTPFIYRKGPKFKVYATRFLYADLSIF